MTSDELRALADALEPMARAPRFADFDVPGFCAWVRACADAEPVAWIARNLTTGRVKWTTDRCRARGWTRDANLRVKLLYTHPAPAAPQAEPQEENIVWKQIIPDDAPQAEPKREPLLGELMREQRQSRIVAGAYPDGNPNAGAMMAQTRQAEPKPTPASGDDLSVYKEMADSYRNDEPTGAPYGIIDPDYGRVYTIARKLAWEEGYAIGLHGSFTRDLDLIAVPWTDTACEPEHLIRRIVDATGLKLRDGVAVKPHGRRAWTLKFPTFGDPRFVDLSVMPRIGGSDAE